MSRIVAFSDTHTQHRGLKVPAGDILIVAGDFSNQGTLADVANFGDWLADLPHPHKIVVAGNHDRAMQERPRVARDLLGEDVTYLLDRTVTVAGLKIHGSPWQSDYDHWAFYRRPQDMKWSGLPYDLDVLVTHMPAYGIRDWDEMGWPTGCPRLAAALARVQPRLHLFGHRHAAAGRGEGHANVAVCNMLYHPVHPVTVIDLPVRGHLLTAEVA